MAWFILSQMFSTLLTLLRLGRTSDKDKDLEILILRQQLNILQRQLDKPIKPNRAEKLDFSCAFSQLEAAKQSTCQTVSEPNSHLPTGNSLWLASTTRQTKMDICQEK